MVSIRAPCSTNAVAANKSAAYHGMNGMVEKRPPSCSNASSEEPTAMLPA